MAHQLPILLTSKNPLWGEFIKSNHAGTLVGQDQVNEEVLLDELRTTTFYSQGVPPSIYWNEEKEAFCNIIEDMLPTS